MVCKDRSRRCSERDSTLMGQRRENCVCVSNVGIRILRRTYLPTSKVCVGMYRTQPSM